MHVRTRTYWVQKEGNPPEDYEDAVWPAAALDRVVGGFRCAVADGATETSFSGLWAGMLVKAWCRGELSGRRLRAALPRLRQEWLSRVRSRPLPWYAEEKLRSGAYSSLLGLTLRDSSRLGNRWEAMAVGDSCLFHLRADKLLVAFPLSHSEQFTSRPYLLSSQPDSSSAGRSSCSDALVYCSGTWEPGDTFYLMTDALAYWFLHAVERHDKPWRTLSPLHQGSCDGDFCDWIAELRRRRLMRNDDVTLLRLEVE